MTPFAAWLEEDFAGFDHAVLTFLHSLAVTAGIGDVLTPVMTGISCFGEKGITVFLWGLWCVLHRKQRDASPAYPYRRTGFCIWGAMGFGTVTGNFILKNWIRRLRPMLATVERCRCLAGTRLFVSVRSCDGSGGRCHSGVMGNEKSEICVAVALCLCTGIVQMLSPCPLSDGCDCGNGSRRAVRTSLRRMCRCRIPQKRELPAPVPLSLNNRKNGLPQVQNVWYSVLFFVLRNHSPEIHRFFRNPPLQLEGGYAIMQA